MVGKGEGGALTSRAQTPILSRMRAAILHALGLALLSPPLAAQTAWVGPQPPCDIKPGYFRLNSVPVNFKTAYEKPVQRDRMLGQTRELLNRAITQDKQDGNPAAWYYLGRYYVEVADAAGADSAFDRAVALAPQCAADIDGYRRVLWSDVYAAGQRTRQEGKADSATLLLNAAYALLPSDARPLYALGAMFATREQVDSATAYLRRAVEQSAGDTAYDAARREALGQVARLHFRRAQAAPAVQASGRSRFSRDSLDRQITVDSTVLARMQASAAGRRARGARLSPADQQAFTRDSGARAQALAATRAAREPVAGRASADSAAAWPALGPAIEASRALVAAFPDDGDGVSALATLYAQSGRVGEAATTLDAIYPAASSLDGAFLIDAGRRVIRAGLPGPGAAVLARGLAKAPYDRDGWNDLAVAWQRLRNGPGMVQAARRVAEIDPLNRSALRQLATAFDLAGQPDSARRYEAIADTGIAVEVTVSSFVPGDGGYTLTGIAGNYSQTPSRPIRLTFEFVDGSGAAISSAPVDIPAIPAQGTHQFEVRVAGTAARGWRYRLN
jgi:tetratricopeptide (TPR) repeat protein